MLPTEDLFAYVCVLVNDAIGRGAVTVNSGTTRFHAPGQR